MLLFENFSSYPQHRAQARFLVLVVERLLKLGDVGGKVSQSAGVPSVDLQRQKEGESGYHQIVRPFSQSGDGFILFLWRRLLVERGSRATTCAGKHFTRFAGLAGTQAESAS
jgi:hypothetical protein